MSGRVSWVCGLVMLGMSLGGAFAGDDVTLEGSYVWVRDDEEITGDLKAVFSPKNEGMWDVSFYFDWEDEPRVFGGTANGSLSAGELEGKVISDDEDHELNFLFEGAFEDGTFTGTHYFVNEGERKRSGTLKLQSPD